MATKFATKKSIPVTSTEQVASDPMTRYAEAHAGLMDAFNLPTGRRLIVASVVSLLSYGATFYWTLQAIEIVSVIAVAYTSSMFLGFMISLLGFVLAFYAGMKISYFVFKRVVAIDMSKLTATGKSIKDASTRRVSLVKGWFTKTDPREDIDGMCNTTA